MKQKPKAISFKEWERQQMQDPEFVEELKKIEPRYQLARQIIGARLKKKMTLVEIAQRAGTNQAVITRLEGMNFNPSLDLIRRVAQALETPITLVIE